MITLVDVCQSFPGCEMTIGSPLVGVVVDPRDAECVAYRLPVGSVEECIELGDIVPLGRLYGYPAISPGEIVAYHFTEAL